jgi:hypothetical protein
MDQMNGSERRNMPSLISSVDQCVTHKLLSRHWGLGKSMCCMSPTRNWHNPHVGWDRTWCMGCYVNIWFSCYTALLVLIVTILTFFFKSNNLFPPFHYSVRLLRLVQWSTSRNDRVSNERKNLHTRCQLWSMENYCSDDEAGPQNLHFMTDQFRTNSFIITLIFLQLAKDWFSCSGANHKLSFAELWIYV